jgi:hypothetical protein
VLMRNGNISSSSGDQRLLPFSPSANRTRLFVGGPNANDSSVLLSNYHGSNNLVASNTPLESLQRRGVVASYAEGCSLSGNDTSGIRLAASAAASASAAVLFLGLNSDFSDPAGQGGRESETHVRTCMIIHICHNMCHRTRACTPAGAPACTMAKQGLMCCAVRCAQDRHTLAFPGRQLELVSRPFPSWNRSMLTEIYLCHTCSCQEILRTETVGQAKAVIAAQPHTVIVLICAGAIDVTPLLELPSSASVSRPFPSWNWSILTEIYLCHACSDHEILRTKPAALHRVGWLRRRAGRGSHRRQ